MLAMSVSVHKLRRLLLAGGVLLVVALVAFVALARYKARHFLHDLPARLGADIKSETNGFTYSQSIKGKTLFTLHASKAIQRQNGKTTLHDVSIELYGRTKDEAKTNRTDRISGAEFEYDQPAGVIRAAGEVHIDLQTPAGETMHETHGENDGRVHMKTSGLMFEQKTGVARTDNAIEFHLNEVQGAAVGAEYDSDAGVLLLKRDVHLVRDADGKRSTLDAVSATIDRSQQLAELNDARYLENGQTMHAAKMFIDLDASGSPTRLRGETVLITEANGAAISAPRAVAAVGPDHRVHSAQLTGGVRYNAQAANGEAREARIAMGPGGLESADFSGNVRLHDEANGSARDLTAQTVSVSPGGEGTKLIRATGDARWHSTGADAIEMSADSLTATVVSAAAGSGLGSGSLRHVRGEGHASLNQQVGPGMSRHTSAETLDVALKPVASAKGAKRPAGNEAAIEHAVEDGGVVIVERRTADAKTHRAASETKAFAGHAEFTGATGVATLTGSPRIESDGTSLLAERIRVNQATGDAVAEGGVKGSLAGAREATHVVAGRAELHRARDLAIFYAAAGEDARLWQGSSQVIASRIELEQGKQQLRAFPADGKPVRAVLPMNGVPGKAEGAKAKMFAGSVRVSAQSLVYDGKAAHPAARLGGGVRMLQTGGTISSDSLVVTFKPQTKAQAAGAMPTGELEQVRAEGNVKLAQPGRSGTGSLLIYTSATDEFALTGSAAAPPRIQDAERGSITGDSLIFHAGDDSVIVAATPGKRVHTETRVDR